MNILCSTNMFSDFSHLFSFLHWLLIMNIAWSIFKTSARPITRPNPIMCCRLERLKRFRNSEFERKSNPRLLSLPNVYPSRPFSRSNLRMCFGLERRRKVELMIRKGTFYPRNLCFPNIWLKWAFSKVKSKEFVSILNRLRGPIGESVSNTILYHILSLICCRNGTSSRPKLKMVFLCRET